MNTTLQMVLVCCSEPLGWCIHPPPVASLTAHIYSLVLALGQLRLSPNLGVALSHRQTEAGYRRPAPLPQGRMNFMVRFLLVT